MSRRILVTGSRYWADRSAVRRALDEQYLGLEEGTFTVVHGGCASGADAYAAEWAQQNATHGVVEETHAAAWDRTGRGAGPIRNRHMVRLGADLVLAFLQPGQANNGTRNCIALARAAGLTVRTYPEETP